jgi:parallel beta-helix repeat protein
VQTHRATVIALLLTTLSFIGPATARDWIIKADGSGDAPTIQAGIDSALVGDSVILEADTYAGPGNRDINFGGKAIIVTGVSAVSTTIDCGSVTAGFTFNSGEGGVSTLTKVTIRNANASGGDGGGIVIQDASPTVTNCVIESCNAGNGAGIYVWQSTAATSPVIRFNQITGNAATAWGGGIWVRGPATPTIDGNTVSGNSAANGAGIAVTESDAAPVITGNIVHDNTASAMGGGFWAFDTRAGLLTLSGNIFYGNGAPDGGGLYLERTNGAVVNTNTVAENSATNLGSGLFLTNTSVTIFTTIVAFNTGAQAVYCFNPSPKLDCCLIWNPGVDDTYACQGINPIAEDPQFCGSAGSHNYLVQSDSKALAANNGPACGLQIGALGQGCTTTPVESTSWGAIKAIYE